jgi:hypothetical protein
MLIVATLLQAGFRRSHLLYLVYAVAGLLIARTSLGAVNPPNPKDLTQGTWQVDLAQSKYCGGVSQGEAVLKSSRRHIYDAGWGLITVHWTGTRADDQPFDVWYVYRYDGEKYPASIMEPNVGEAITWKLVNPHRVEFTHWTKDNKITQRLVRSISEDGQVMTQTTRYTNRPGCAEVQVFNRVPDAARPRFGESPRPRGEAHARQQ